MELRVKDLRQYLESKRINMAGCREKSELADLVLQHCCSEAFMQQQAENQRRLRELTRRKEAEEEWEQRHHGHHESSPDSDSPHRRDRAASSSPETTSGADDPDVIEGDDVSMTGDLDPHASSTQESARLTRPDNFHIFATNRSNQPPMSSNSNNHHVPVFEVIGDRLVQDDFDEFGVEVVDQNFAPPRTAPTTSPSANSCGGSGAVSPPSYEDVMGAGVTGAGETFVDFSRIETPLESTVDNEERTPPLERSTSRPIPTTEDSSERRDTTYSSSLGGEGGTDSQASSPSRFLGRRRIKLEEIEQAEHIKELSPRQLKEILTSNFVAYKGCCERWELEDRVNRLWAELKSNQEVLKATLEKDGAEESNQTEPSTVGHPDVDANICKICWDAVIDCVLLECGHMVTCTNCGRRMAECPICRQYVVRAVHVFRA